MILDPRIIFDNTEAREESILDKKSIIRVLANENLTHTTTDLHHHQNNYAFHGTETELEMSRAYNTEFLCEYSMAWYPFDSQTCHLDFVLDASAAAFVTGVIEPFPNYAKKIYNFTKDVIWFPCGCVK